MGYRTSNYYTLCQLANNRFGYCAQKISQLEQLFKSLFSDEEFAQQELDLTPEHNKYIYSVLFKNYKAGLELFGSNLAQIDEAKTLIFQKNSEIDLSQPLFKMVLAEYCLRCYISHAIIDKGKKIISGKDNIVLPSILNPILNDVWENKDKQFKCLNDENFSFEILKTYRLESLDSKALYLENWVYLKIKQNKNLNKYLYELYGWSFNSKWAILNKLTYTAAEELGCSDAEINIIRVYHQIYRGDRRKAGLRNPCQEPTEEQKERMLDLLKGDFANIDGNWLINELEKIADHVLPYYHQEPREREEDEVTPWVNEQPNIELQKEFANILYPIITEQFFIRTQKLQSSKAYAIFAPKFLTAYEMLYEKGMSLGSIGEELGMGKTHRASRILNPTIFLDRILKPTDFQDSARSEVLNEIIEKRKVQDKRLAEDPDYLREVSAEIAKDLQICFAEAKAELETREDRRTMQSLYAKIMRHYLLDLQNSGFGVEAEQPQGDCPERGNLDIIYDFFRYHFGVAHFEYGFYLLAIAELLNKKYFKLLRFYFYTLIQQRMKFVYSSF